jgi:hypothetical protein
MHSDGVGSGLWDGDGILHPGTIYVIMAALRVTQRYHRSREDNFESLHRKWSTPILFTVNIVYNKEPRLEDAHVTGLGHIRLLRQSRVAQSPAATRTSNSNLKLSSRSNEHD